MRNLTTAFAITSILMYGQNMSIPMNAEKERSLSEALQAAVAEGDADTITRQARQMLELFPNDPRMQAPMYLLLAEAARKQGDSARATMLAASANLVDPGIGARTAPGGGATRGDKAATMDTIMAVMGQSMQAYTQIRMQIQQQKMLALQQQQLRMMQQQQQQQYAGQQPVQQFPQQPVQQFPQQPVQQFPQQPVQQFPQQPVQQFPQQPVQQFPQQPVQQFPQQPVQQFPQQPVQQFPEQQQVSQQPFPQGNAPTPGWGGQAPGAMPPGTSGGGPFSTPSNVQFSAPGAAPYGTVGYVPQAGQLRGEKAPVFAVLHDRSQVGSSAYFEQSAAMALTVSGSALLLTPANGEMPRLIPAVEVIDLGMNRAVGRDEGVFHISTKQGLYLSLMPTGGGADESRRIIADLRERLKLGE